MSNNTGVFGLSGFNDKNLEGLIPDKTRETYREYGYFGAGLNPAFTPISLSVVDRIDFSSDTSIASIRQPLLIQSYENGSCGNSNFGYVAGGIRLPGLYTNIQRIEYSNETTTLRGNLNFTKRGTTGLGNNNFGYMCGGRNIPTPTYSTVERIDYSNDIANISYRGPLVAATYEVAATSNANFGYIGGTPSFINRINFSNDSTTALNRGVFDIRRMGQASAGNSNFGYFCGGSAPATISSVERINYANDTASTSPRGPLSEVVTGSAGTGNSNFGYISAGTNPSGRRVKTDRIDYSNDTVTSTVRGNLSTPRSQLAATSSHSFGGAPNSSFASNFTFPTVPNAGYFGGGTDGTNNLATIDRVDYANDTSTVSLRSALSVARRGLAATGNSSFGYFGGGDIPGTISTVNRIKYSSGTENTVTRGPLSLARAFLTATGNSNFGYFGGGGDVGGPYRTIIDRIDYSNDSTSASVRGPLSIIVYNSRAATGNQNFGYLGAGTVPGLQSRIHRIDYANDLLTAGVRTSLSLSVGGLTATGNSNFGYFGGGFVPGPTPISIVNRIDYANDTATASVRGPLSSAKRYLAATGTQNFGYFGGGEGVPGLLFSIDRIDYSNDTVTASVRGLLSSARQQLAATSPLAYGGAPIYFTNPLPEVLQKQIEFNDSNTLDLPFKRVLGSFGYFGGGSTPASTTLSSTNRIDYSNDTVTASVRGNLSLARRFVGGAGNSNFGYHGGGFVPGISSYTTVDRIDYSNDSSNALIRTPLLGIGYHSGFGNQFYGYFASSQGLTTISRVDFSNDTSVSLRNILQRSAYYRAATGNNNYGYIQEGLNTSVSPIVTTSLVERVQYSNDNQKTLIRGPLSIARRSSGATGNSNFGYYAGGSNTSIPAAYSTIDRIDYANDTATASVRGRLLSEASAINEGTGNSNFGYFSGFSFPTTGSGSSVNRINYSNDTATASARGPLSSTRYVAGASTNARFS